MAIIEALLKCVARKCAPEIISDEEDVSPTSDESCGFGVPRGAQNLGNASSLFPENYIHLPKGWQ
jgi:hypothetical protein